MGAGTAILEPPSGIAYIRDTTFQIAVVVVTVFVIDVHARACHFPGGQAVQVVVPKLLRDRQPPRPGSSSSTLSIDIARWIIVEPKSLSRDTSRGSPGTGSGLVSS